MRSSWPTAMPGRAPIIFGIKPTRRFGGRVVSRCRIAKCFAACLGPQHGARFAMTRAETTRQYERSGSIPFGCTKLTQEDAFAQILELLKTNGVECQEVQLPNLDEISEMHGRIFFVEGAAYHYANFKEHIGSYPTIAQSWFAAALQARRWVIMSMHLRRGFDLPARSIACWRRSMSY